MSASSISNILVCGAGAFGQNHLRVYRDLESAGQPVHLAAIVEPDPARATQLHAQYALPVFGSMEEAFAAQVCPFHAASVCSPTSTHHATVTDLLRRGMDVLVEKPIATTRTEAEDLVSLAQSSGRILQVGHLERFNPAITAVEPLLNGPMFFEAHRLSIFSPRSLDIDVVLDLMIHDLDIVLNFAQSRLCDLRAAGLPILSGKVDIANVRLEFESGCVANFTASRVSTERVRKLRFFQPHQYLSIDYARQDLLIIDVSPGQVTTPDSIPTHAPAAAHPSPGLSIRKPPIRQAEPLRLEIESFLESVRTRSAPRVTGRQAMEALSLALDINAAIEDHARHAGLHRFSAPPA